MEDKCEAEGSPRTGRAGARPYRPNLRVHPRSVSSYSRQFVSIRGWYSLRIRSRLEIIFDLGFSHFDVFPGHTEPDPVPGVVHVPFKIPHAFRVFRLSIRS
jgi:hypothetical protein